MKPIDPENLRRTAAGIVPSFDVLFTDVRRVVPDREARQRGHHGYPPGAVYLATDHFRDNSLPQSVDLGGKWVLVCTPVIDLPEFAPCPAPSSGYPWVNRKCETLRVIPWPHHGHYLVIAANPTHLRDHWLAFVPMSAALPIRPGETV